MKNLKLPRRNFLHLAAGAAAMPVMSRTASAQAYPNRPVRIIVGFPPGGQTDIVGRLIAQALSERLGQQFVVENRPGAGTNLGTEAVVRAAPDGYTLLVVPTSSTVNQSVFDKLSFDIRSDIAMVAGLIKSPLMFVSHPSLQPKTVPELIAYAKANPGKVTLASFGTATTSHVTGELFKMMTGVNMVHVPYRGGVPMATDLIAGQVHSAVDVLPQSLGHIRAGRLHALAVCSATRSEFLPNVPSMSEFLPTFEGMTWNAIGAPKNTPPAIISKLNSEITAALGDPKLKARITDLGAEVFISSPAELRTMVTEEIDKWAKVVKFANIKPE